MKVVINEHIIADPEICHGKPVFTGTRVMVWQVLDMLANGENAEGVLRAFPSLKPEYISSALSYAASVTQEHYAIINTGPQIPA